MHVTKIEPVTKTKYSVFMDGQFAFVLYKGELSRYHIAEGQEIEEELYRKIKEEVIVKRAKLYAMHLLNDCDRTEQQLLSKLKQALYTEDVAGEALAYVKSFGYVNDEAYAERFVRTMQGTKSRREIYALLLRKGIPSAQIEAAMGSGYEEEDETAAVHRLMRKKKYDPRTADEKTKQKFYRYLAGKGFGYETIKRGIESFAEE